MMVLLHQNLLRDLILLSINRMPHLVKRFATICIPGSIGRLTV